MTQLCNQHHRSGFLPSGGAHPLQRPFTRSFPKRTSVLLTPHQTRVRCGIICRYTFCRRVTMVQHCDASLGVWYSVRITHVMISCRAQMSTAERLKPVRKAAAAAVLALLAVSCQGRAFALEADSVQSSTDAASSGAPTPIYFGNGCFWGRQKDYIDAEKSMGRSKSGLSAVVGYAGGQRKGTVISSQSLRLYTLICTSFISSHIRC